MSGGGEVVAGEFEVEGGIAEGEAPSITAEAEAEATKVIEALRAQKAKDWNFGAGVADTAATSVSRPTRPTNTRDYRIPKPRVCVFDVLTTRPGHD